MSRLIGIRACNHGEFLAGLLKERLSPRHRVRVASLDRATMGIAYTGRRSFSAVGVTLDGPPIPAPLLQSLVLAVAEGNEPLLTTMLNEIRHPFGLAVNAAGRLLLARDATGSIPLYTAVYQGALCYASEIKLLKGWAGSIRILPPGTWSLDESEPRRFASLPPGRPERKIPPEKWRAQLRSILQKAVAAVGGTGCGVLLSGGLDSSVIAVLAAEAGYRCTAFTVACGGRDEENAVAVARKLGWPHHIIKPEPRQLLASLPEVIYRLESFDAPLVRSAVVNHQVNALAAEYVDKLLCGEGADELFAGYDHLKELTPDELPPALDELLASLPAGGIQRVDRMAHAHGLEPRVPFLSPSVVSLAARMPAEIKIGPDGREKWILRQACRDILPPAVADRPKEKFSVGCGSSEILHDILAERISDADFEREKKLPDGTELRSKEELHYYRIFRELFGEECLALVGRTA